MKYIIFSIFLLVTRAVFAQNDDIENLIESLVDLGQKIGFDESKSDSLMLIANQLEELSLKHNNRKAKIFAHRYKGWSYDYAGKHDKALKEQLAFLEIANKYNMTNEKLMAYGDMGYIYMATNRLAEAKKIFLEPTKDLALIKAQPKKLSAFFNNLGIVYKKEKKLDSALLMYNKSVELKKIAKDTVGILILQTNMAILYADQSKFALARTIFEENIKLANQQKNDGDVWHNLASLGGMLINQGEYPEALKILLESKELAMKIKNNSFLVKNIDLLSDCYEKMGNLKEALALQKESRKIAEEYLNEETNKNISQLREEFDAEERENQNRILNQELALEKNKKLMLLSGLILSLAIVCISIFAWRKNQVKNRKLALQNDLINQQNDRLKELNDEKNKLIGIISHDIRTPFHSINLWAQNLKGFIIKDPQKAEESAETILKLASQGQAMVNQILNIERLEMADKNTELTIVNLDELISELIADFEPAASGKSIQVLFENNLLDNKPILSEQNMLRRALENLISNALKFSKRESKIVVEISEKEKNICISVVDQGVGISENELPNLFKAYSNTSTLPTENEDSTGLGLHIVKRIMDELGGKIDVVSEVGIGSTFTISLPA